MSTVTDQLMKLGVTYEVISHAQAYTSIDEALALGISADEVLKTIVLNTTASHALAMIPGSRRLDIRATQSGRGETRPAGNRGGDGEGLPELSARRDAAARIAPWRADLRRLGGHAACLRP
jgi:hypothetical protein